jgi:hypothetical protein
MSEKVRQRMEDGLLLNLSTIFHRYNIEFQLLERYFGRILISVPKKSESLAGKVLNFVFGFVSYSPILYIEKQDSALRTALKNYLLAAAKMHPSLQTAIENKIVPLAITVRSSDENIKREVFAHQCFQILQHEIPGVLFVQEWKNPVFDFEVEIRDLRYYIYREKIELNWRGLPIEDRSGAVLNSIGTYSDLLSALLIMKRGIHVFPLYFNLNIENKGSEKNRKANKEIFLLLMRYYPKDMFFTFEIDHVQLMTRVSKKISKFLKNKPKELANEKYYTCNLCMFIRTKLAALFCKNYQQYLIQSLFEFGEEILDSNFLKVLTKSDRKKLLDSLKNEQKQQNYASILKPSTIKYESIIIGDFGHSYCPFSLDRYYPLRNLDYLLMFPLISFDEEKYREKIRLIDPLKQVNLEDIELPVDYCPFKSIAAPIHLFSEDIKLEFNKIQNELYTLFESESWLISILEQGKIKKMIEKPL